MSSSKESFSLTKPTRRWGVCLLIAAIVAWAWMNYTPVKFEIPDELLGVDMYSPADMQKAAAEASEEVYWQNSLVQMGIAGLCFGAVPLLSSIGPGGRKRWVSIVVGLVAGIACGLLATFLGTKLRTTLDAGIPLTFIDEGSRQLVADVVIYMATSMMLVLPICLALLVSRGEQRRAQDFGLILLAAIVAGAVAPLIAAIFPKAQTHVFPPEGQVLTAIWLALLAVCVFVFTSSTSSRSPETQPSETA